jgi:predicted kinase
MILNELFTTVDEGIQDPDIFKALMLIGGPASGKTTVGEHLISGTGIRSVNTDAFYEMIKSRHWLADKPGKTRADMPGWDSPQDIQSDPDWNTSTKSQYSRLELLVEGRLGIMLDMTGQKAESTQQYRQELEQLGYDVAMLYVKTPVEVAQQRNAARRRRVDPDTLVNIHTAVNTNATYYKIMFRDKMVILDNHQSQPVHHLLTSTEDFHCDKPKLHPRARDYSLARWFREWLAESVNNPAALAWKQTQLKSLGRRVYEDINKKSSSAPTRGGVKILVDAGLEPTEKQLLARKLI